MLNEMWLGLLAMALVFAAIEAVCNLAWWLFWTLIGALQQWWFLVAMVGAGAAILLCRRVSASVLSRREANRPRPATGKGVLSDKELRAMIDQFTDTMVQEHRPNHGQGVAPDQDWMERVFANLDGQLEDEARASAEEAQQAEGDPVAGEVREAEARMLRADLAILGLHDLPTDGATLKRAFRKALLASHPDHGGSAVATADLVAARDRLVARLGR